MINVRLVAPCKDENPPPYGRSEASELGLCHSTATQRPELVLAKLTLFGNIEPQICLPKLLEKIHPDFGSNDNT